jgi:hypothetical protein
MLTMLPTLREVRFRAREYGRGHSAHLGQTIFTVQGALYILISQRQCVTRIGLHRRSGLHSQGKGPTAFNRQKIKVRRHNKVQ